MQGKLPSAVRNVALTTAALLRRPGKRAWMAMFFIAVSLLGLLFWLCLPNPLFNDDLSRVLYSRDGKLLGAQIAKDQQWRFPRLEKQLPDKFVTALLHYEDKRFYQHMGVDPLAVARAFKQNFSADKVVSGASTITMQVVRLMRKNPPRTYWEKLQEMFIALRLEAAYDKSEILSLYAAHAPFGGNVVGLDAAAWRYFSRPAERLSWGESALLAVLPNNPAMMHPGRQRIKLRQKRDRLLTELHHDSIINDLDYQLAMAETIPDEPQALPQLAPHLLATLSKQQTQQRLFSSRIDYYLQNSVNQIVKHRSDSLSQQGINNAAVLVIDNQNFDVLAYVGNSQWAVNNQQGYAVDIIQRPRSTGSVLKPLLFASMLQQGEILSSTLVPDIPTHMGSYRPENYDRGYRGAVPARVALARSLNIPAVRMLQSHGVRRFYDTLKNMGMNSLFRDADGYGLALILGGSEGSLWDLTQMYANLAYIAKQKTTRPNATYFAAKLTSDQSTQTNRRVDMQAGAAWLTLQALQFVSRPNGDSHWRNFASSQRIAWKTGTSYGLRDGWAIGSNQRYTVGVWVGNASGEGKPGLTGLSSAAPILFDVFNYLPATPWFARPDAMLTKVTVCREDGLLSNGNCKTKSDWMPIEAGFQRVSHHYQRVHLDSSGRWRVHSHCEPVSHMQHVNWFSLPPTQAYYYKKHHSQYKTLPPYRKDCSDALHQASYTKQNKVMELVYPSEMNTKIYIPIDLAGSKSQTILEAVHKSPDTTIYWHLNDTYLGATKTFHRLAVDIAPGKYTLTLVDEDGNTVSTKLEVLGKSSL